MLVSFRRAVWRFLHSVRIAITFRHPSKFSRGFRTGLGRRHDANLGLDLRSIFWILISVRFWSSSEPCFCISMNAFEIHAFTEK